MLDLFTTFYSDQEAGGEAAEPSAGTKNTDNEQQPQQSGEPMIPKSRFDEVNTKYKELQNRVKEMEAQLTAFQQAQADAERKSKEEQGKFKELYEQQVAELDKYKNETKQMKERAERLEKYINSMLEAKLENVPEDMRELIPEGLSPEEKLLWVEKAEKRGLFGKTVDEPIGSSANPISNNASDVSTLSPFQLLRLGYGGKRK